MTSASHREGVEDAIVPLARHVATTVFEDLPPEVAPAVRKSILDCLAATIAGSSAPGVTEVRSALREWGGKPESTVALFGDRLPAHDAAFVNVVMSHALELDDAHYPAIVHPTTPTFWPALATAEVLGGVTGKQLIAAVALGVDLMARLALAGPRTIDLGYHTALYSVFGATAATAKLRGLDEKQIRNALGIAFAQAAATVQAGVDGALVKRLQPAFGASNGMKAVLFAQRGITGVSNVLSGAFGLYRLFNHSDCDRDVLLDRLGSHYLGTELSIKRYPSSRCSHAAIEGTLELVRDHNILPEDVAEAIVEVQAGCFKREQRPYDPHSGTPQVAAQFSIDYNVAAAILWRDVFIRQIQDAATLDPRALALAHKVKVRKNEREPGSSPYVPVNITLRLNSGNTVATTVRSLRGSPADPLSWDEVVSERLGRCLGFSAVALPEDRVSVLSALIADLESVPDVRKVAAMLVP